MKSFYRQAEAFFKGDTDGVKAEKIYRQATAFIRAEISNAEGALPQLEVFVEQAEEEVSKALLNYGAVQVNKAEYISALYRANNDLNDAKKKLSDKQKEIEFLKTTLADADKEVEEIEEKA